MILQELMKSVDFEVIWPTLRDTYFQKDTLEMKEYTEKEKAKIHEVYDKCYERMKGLSIDSCSDSMIMTVMKKFDIDYGVEDDEKDKEIEIFDVSAYDSKTDEFYGVEFTDWSKLLAEDVCQLSIDKYGAEECLAHILWELTFCGIEPESITKEREKIEDALRESEKVGFSDCKTWDELKKELGFEERKETEEEIEARRALFKRINDKNMQIRKEFTDAILANK